MQSSTPTQKAKHQKPTGLSPPGSSDTITIRKAIHSLREYSDDFRKLGSFLAAPIVLQLSSLSRCAEFHIFLSPEPWIFENFQQGRFSVSHKGTESSISIIDETNLW